MDLDKYIRIDTAIWGDTDLDNKISALAEKYGIGMSGKVVKGLSDRISFLLPENEDKRAYRKALQIFDLCRLEGDAKVKGIFGGEEKTMEVDGVLFGVFSEMRDALIEQEYGGGNIDEIHEEIKMQAETERRDEVLLRRGLIRRIVDYLRGEGVFNDPGNPKNIGNPEAALVYDLISEVGYPLDQYYDWVKMTNKKKKDAVKVYL